MVSSQKINNTTDYREFLLRNDAVLVDLRNIDDYQINHLDDAKNIDLMAQHFVEFFSNLNKQTPVLLYCSDGSRSRVAVKILGEMGYKNLAELNGGIKNWSIEVTKN